jgi:prevent-host-death family protein
MLISAAEFKAKCLKLMDKVNWDHEEIVITKHGKKVARLIHAGDETKPDIYGVMEKRAVYSADIIDSTDEKWNAE